MPDTEKEQKKQEKTDTIEEDPPEILGPSQIMLRLIQESGDRFIPIRRPNGTPLMLLHDIDRNGGLDAFVLSVDKKSGPPIEHELRDVSRLYSEDPQAVNYYLSVFFQIDGELISMYRIPLGGRMVLDSFRDFSLSPGKSKPYGIEVVFREREGSAIEWIIFSHYNRFSLFSFRKTVSSGAYTEDIDQDGVLDLVEWRKGIEEGTGYETFLTWYRYNGSAYREAGSSNVVRKLNRFLADFEAALLTNDPDKLNDFLEYPLEESEREQALDKIFRQDKEIPGRENAMENCTNLVSIVYPPILESPFELERPSGRRFSLDMRLICSSGESVLCSVEIALDRNPFRGRSYYVLQGADLP